MGGDERVDNSFAILYKHTIYIHLYTHIHTHIYTTKHTLLSLAITMMLLKINPFNPTPTVLPPRTEGGRDPLYLPREQDGAGASGVEVRVGVGVGVGVDVGVGVCVLVLVWVLVWVLVLCRCWGVLVWVV